MIHDDKSGFTGLNVFAQRFATLERNCGPAVRNNFLVPRDAFGRNSFLFDAKRAFREFAVRAVENIPAVANNFFHRRFERRIFSEIIKRVVRHDKMLVILAVS